MTPARVVAGLALVALACLTPAAPAQTFTWQNTNGAWSTGTNWVGGTAPPAGGGSGVVLKFVADNTTRVTSWDEFRQVMAGRRGFIIAGWCGDAECEARIKQETKATVRVIPFEGEARAGSCVRCGRPSEREVYFAQAY